MLLNGSTLCWPTVSSLSERYIFHHIIRVYFISLEQTLFFTFFIVMKFISVELAAEFCVVCGVLKLKGVTGVWSAGSALTKG